MCTIKSRGGEDNERGRGKVSQARPNQPQHETLSDAEGEEREKRKVEHSGELLADTVC